MHKVTFKNIEPYLFLLVCIMNMIPVLQGRCFSSMDGAAHLYNSNLINNLLFGNSELISSYFTFNPEPVPNTVGHIILSFFNLFLPAFYAEKIVLIFYLLGLPLAFRSIIKTVNPKNILISYFIFPFTYTHVFLLGFYNFSIAIVFMLLALRFWIANESNNFTLKKSIWLFSLILLTYFSHIFVFAILFIIIAIHILYKSVYNLLLNNKSINAVIMQNLKRVTLLIVVTVIPLILFIYYILSRNGLTNNIYIDTQQLIDWLKNIRPIIAYNQDIEEVYTKKIFYILIVFIILLSYQSISNFLEKFHLKNLSITNYKNVITASLYWGSLPLLLLFLYFIMPDSDGSGGFISMRLALFFFLFLIIWFSTQKIQKWLLITSVLAILFLNFKINQYYYSAIKDLNKVVESCYETSDYIEENSLVLPLNYSDNWLTGHFSNYLAIDKPIVILESYESDKGYFPLLWNYENMPNAVLGEIRPFEIPCLYWKSNPVNPTRIIDYVFVLGSLNTINDECGLEIKKAILEKYELIHQNKHCELYKIKP